MTEQNNSQQGIRILVIAAALVIIIGGINQAQSVLVSFLVAVFLAMIALTDSGRSKGSTGRKRNARK